jgi:hypothetical protein
VFFQDVGENGEKFESMTHCIRVGHHFDTTLESLLVLFKDAFTIEKSLIQRYKVKSWFENLADYFTCSLT